MKTILHTGCKLCKNGGIENYIMNLYRKIDRTKFRFIFLVDKEQEDENFADEIYELGGAVYYFDSNQPLYKQIIQKYNILKQIDYSIAHVHVSCGIRAIDGLLLKFAHKKVRLFYHSHSNIGKRPIKYSLLIPIYRIASNKLFACSNVAAQYFFGKNVIRSKKYHLMKNGIDRDKFVYSEASRKKIRSQYALDEKVFLLGYVGRLSVEKNIAYLIDTVYELNKMKFYTKGLIVGDGPEKETLVQYVNKTDQIDNIIFVGNSLNVEQFLCAFDALMLPSYNEGLGIVLIEAQAASLVCFASNVVPVETNISPLIQYFDIKNTPDFTASIIYNLLHEKDYIRPCYQECVDSNGYNISLCVKELEKIYLDV